MKEYNPKEYDLIAIGTGSAMNIVSEILRHKPEMKVAVIDKDEPGGICLTRACIPTKILLYHAELVRTVERAKKFGIDAKIESIDFRKIMKRMRSLIYEDIEAIKNGLESSDLDYYHEKAEFIEPYVLKVGKKRIKSKNIILCTGSKPLIPPIKGLKDTGYLTSDTILKLDDLPESFGIIGGGYVAAEYGHFLSSMGAEITIFGRNPYFLPQEEPEVSQAAKREFSQHMEIVTNHEVVEVKKEGEKKVIVAKDLENGRLREAEFDEILVAAGRASNSDILHPERGGIETDDAGWIKVNEYLETSMPGIYALGDANGRYLFKHVANYESSIVFQNAFLKRKVKVDYSKVPHAVFTHPEIAGVGMKESEAVKEFGDKVLIGFYRYEDTAKGMAMGAENYFVKVILTRDGRILGAHVFGPYASILIHEIIALMGVDAKLQDFDAMHIHPSLSEVVERALYNLMPVEHYKHVKKEYLQLD
ncbi:MAG: dihydrolipoyl dehydrogenase [Archaeoglobus sp.]|nr:dihydrolipoyl dehydrogenase [Archaeoglobus sp.]